MNLLRSESGSSSILMALVLLVLVVFSVLAVTTSAANLRLARRNAETVRAFHSLDSEAERFLNALYNSILSGREKAFHAITCMTGGNPGEAELPYPITDIITATLNGLSGSEERKQYLDRLYEKLAAYFAISLMSEAYPGCVYDMPADYLQNYHIYSNMPVEPGFSVKKTFVLEYEDRYRYLDVDVSVSDPASDESPEKICEIREWRMWQEPFEYDNSIDLWEGVP